MADLDIIMVLLFILISHFNPRKVLESGIWRGFTTMLIDKASSNIQIIYTILIFLGTNIKQKKGFISRMILQNSSSGQV